MRYIFKKKQRGNHEQSTKEEYACHYDFLSLRHIQAPNHRKRETENDDIREQIGYGVSPEECLRIYAGTAFDGLIPIERNGLALKEGREKYRYTPHDNNHPNDNASDREGAGRLKDAAI